MNAIFSSPSGTNLVWADPILVRLLLASIEFAALALVIAVIVKLWGGKRPRVAVYLWAIVLVKPLISLVAGTPLPIVSFAATGAEEQVAEQSARPLENVESNGAVFRTPAEPEPTRQLAAPSEPAASAADIRSRTAADHTLGMIAGSSSSTDSDARDSNGILDWITGLWIIGCIVVAAWLVRSRRAAARLAACGTPASGSLADLYRELSGELAITRPPSLRVADDLPSPALVGVIRPTILVPAWLAEDADDGSDVLRWSLRHELTHYRSGDPLLMLLRDVVRAVFFFHPAAWWCGGRLEEAIEVACDHGVVNDFRQATEYAKGLYELLKRALPQTAPVRSGGLFATRSQIGQRIACLLQGPLSFGGGLGKRTIAAVTLFAVAVFCIGVGTHSTSQAEAQDAKAADAEIPERGTERDAKTGAETVGRRGNDGELVLLEGRVLTPDGRPAAAADVIFTHAIADYTERFRETTWPRAVTDGQGEFRLRVDPSRIELADSSPEAPIGRLYAVAEGAGFGLLEIKDLDESTSGLTLQLASDQPIEGQILDLEGRPVRGAKIHVDMVAWFADKSLDRMVEHIRTTGYDTSLDVAARVPPNLPETVIADAEGRFRLEGLGEERFVRLEVSGPGIHHDKVGVLTRQMPDERVPSPTERGPAYGKKPYYWASFRHLNDAGRTIEGVVRDAATGAPVEGATVECYLTRDSSAVTDSVGQFALHGVLKSDSYRLDIKPPTDGRYLKRYIRVPDEPGLQPQQVNIDLTQGITVHGRFEAVEAERPKRGKIEYFPIYPNANVIDYGVNTTPGNEVEVRADGTFSIAVVPGPGALAFRPAPIDRNRFQTAYVSPEIARAFFGDAALTDGYRFTEDSCIVALATDSGNLARGGMGQEHYAAIELVNPSEDQRTLSLQVEVSPGRTVHGKVVDQDGKPVADVWVGGTNHRLMARRQESAEFEVVGWNPARTRHLFFYQPERKLGAVLDLTAQTETPLTITLKPFGTVSGRLVDPEGEPLVDVPINLTRSRTITGLNEDSRKTDAEGRFLFDNVIPGEVYAIHPVAVPAIVEDDITVAPGEDKDLGDVDVRSSTMRMMKQQGM